MTMSKHAIPTIWPDVEAQSPAHSKDWTEFRASYDRYTGTYWDYFPGRHAKPFAAHHPARPVTYDAAGTTTPLNPPTNVLDVAA